MSYLYMSTYFYQKIRKTGWQMQRKFLVFGVLSIEADFNLCLTEIYYWRAILIRNDMTSAVEARKCINISVFSVEK